MLKKQITACGIAFVICNEKTVNFIKHLCFSYSLSKMIKPFMMIIVNTTT